MAKVNVISYEINFANLISASIRGTMRIMHPEELVISYGIYNQDKKRCMRIAIRIGDDVLKQLKWSIKDRIALYHFPEDLMKAVLIKKDNGNKAVIANGVRPHWQFSIIPHLKMMRSPQFSVDYQIHKLGYLIFNLEDPVVA